MMDKDTNVISLETAQEWAKKWRQLENKNYNAHHNVHGFLIPKEDILLLLEENIDALRAYLGVDENNVEKLMIVGTKYNDKYGTYDDMLPDTAIKGRIYDFTQPCPPACAHNSSLNNLPNSSEE